MSYRLRVTAARALIALGRIRAWRWLAGSLQRVLGAGSRRELSLTPVNDLVPVADRPGDWEATGTDPQFATRDLHARIPKGWCYFDARVIAETSARTAVYVDRGKGFDPDPVLDVETDDIEGARGMVRIPATAVGLRFDPVDRAGSFRLGSVTLVQAAAGVQLARGLRPMLSRLRHRVDLAVHAAEATGRALVLRPARAVVRIAVGLPLLLRPRARVREFAIEPERQLAQMPGGTGRWHALGTEPRFRLTGESIPRGWCRLTTTMSADARPGDPQLFARVRREREVGLARSLKISDSGRVHGRVYVPVRARELLWDPVGGSGEFEQHRTVEVRPITVFPWTAPRKPSGAQADGPTTSVEPGRTNGSSTSTPAKS